jgi:hypothetical protein
VEWLLVLLLPTGICQVHILLLLQPLLLLELCWRLLLCLEGC